MYVQKFTRIFGAIFRLATHSGYIGIISDWQFSDNCVTLCIFVDPIC